MLQVKQFRYHTDNLGYLIYGERYAMAVDGGAHREILSFLNNRNLNLLYVTNTHAHADHTSGNRALLHESNAEFLLCDGIQHAEIKLEGRKIKVYSTPGHTADSVCFHVHNVLITGDTLFNGTIGNCFTGDLKSFYGSIKKIISLPDNTVIYAGHDYVKEAMNFAKRIEPENEYIKIYLKNYTPEHVLSRLAEECKVNPYLRFNENGVINVLKENRLPRQTEWERWQSLMSID